MPLGFVTTLVLGFVGCGRLNLESSIGTLALAIVFDCGAFLADAMMISFVIRMMTNAKILKLTSRY